MERRPPDPPSSGGRRDEIARGATRVLLEGHPGEPAGGLFPERIGPYRREHRLGQGGMGVVYRYRDTKLDRLVAVKTMPAEVAREPDLRARFEHEARILASLEHANIGRIHHLYEHAGVEYLILEFVPGETLEERLARGPLALDRALAIALQVAHAIEAGHEANVVHRDIKPGNIMVTPSDVAKLLDYGLALWQPMPTEWDGSFSWQPGASTRPGATRPGHVMGTPGYMSPEQARGELTEERADAWAFGCVLFKCLTGAVTFPGATDQERIAATLDREPAWDALPPDTPEAIVTLLRRCLAKPLVSRLSDLGEACRIIESCLSEPSAGPKGLPLPSNLPAQLTSYVRRSGESERLRQLMRGARLLTLTGPGGCGKTRLAVETASESAAAGRGAAVLGGALDGVWFIELAALAEPGLVAQEFAKVLRGPLGLEPDPNHTTIDVLIERLRTCRPLLIVDNCEHVTTGCRCVVSEILARCPHVRVIATSRERLHVPGEQVYVVPGLFFPPARATVDPVGAVVEYEAVRLFVDRAALARIGFTLTAESAGAVAEICRRLEGIPLAIELAAARVGSMPVGEVAAHLLDVLDPARILESSIDGSVRLLSDAERTLLGRLTVFRGGWTLEAAESVCTPAGGRIEERTAVDLLGQVVDKSLVLYEERDDRARYHLLEMVRAYGEARLLDADDRADVRRRHLDFYLDLAREAVGNFDGEEQAAWLNRVETEHDNIRRALAGCGEDGVDPDSGAAFVTALHRFWRIRGHLGEAREWIRQALKRRGAARDVLQIQTLNAAGTIAGSQGDFETARNQYQAGLAIAREIGDARRAAGILTNLGLLEQEHGDLKDARACHEESMALYRSLRADTGVAWVQLNLGAVARMEGGCAEARRLFDECLPVFRKSGDKQRIAAILHNLAEVAVQQGALEEALRFARESLEIRWQLLDRRGIAETMRWLGVIAERSGAYERAARLFGAAAAILDTIDAPVSPPDTVLFEESRRAVRENLVEDLFTKSWGHGRLMTVEQAVEAALG